MSISFRIAGILLVFLQLSAVAAAQTPWAVANRIIADTELPAIPKHECEITAFGAKPDSGRDASAAITNAVRACHLAGGGRVIIPKGIFLTGAILLYDKIELHLETGAVLRFTADPARYPPVRTRYQGIDFIGHAPPIYAGGHSDVAITGAGELDLAATAVWNVKSSDAWDKLQKEAVDGVPIPDRIHIDDRNLPVPMIETFGCRRVLVQGITIRNASWWQIHPLLSRDVTIDGVTFISASQNRDGCDPEGSERVVIKGCRFQTGDDAVSVKAGRNQDSRRKTAPAKNIVILDSTFEGAWTMLAIGSEMSDGVRNVFAHNLSGTARYGIIIKTNSERGGYVRDVFVDGVDLTAVQGSDETEAVQITGNYMDASGNRPPRIREIHLSRIHARGVSRALDITGLPERPIRRLRISDSDFADVKKDNVMSGVRSPFISKVSLNGRRLKEKAAVR